MNNTYSRAPIVDLPTPSIGAITSLRLIPGQTLTATILLFWAFALTMGTVLPLGSSVLGTWPEGRASRTRWRWRVNTAVRSARWPSRRKVDLGAGIGVEGRERDGEKDGAEAA